MIMAKKIIELLLVLVLSAAFVYVGIVKLASFYHNKGVNAYKAGEYKDASDFFKRSLRIISNRDTYDYLAYVYEKLDNPGDAAKIYRRLISADPSRADAYIALSNTLMLGRRFAEALDIARQARARIPDDQDIENLYDRARLNCTNEHINQGIIARAAGEKKDAYNLLNKALELDPESVYAHYILGYFYYIDNYLKRAEDKMNDVMRLEPGYWQAYKLLGDIYYKDGKYDMAVKAYRRILSSNYDDYVAYNDIAISLMQIERYDQAIIYLKEASRLNPENLDIMYNLASTYRDVGMYEQAVMEYDRLSKRDDAYPNMYNNLAEIYNTRGEKGLAIDAYYKEIENSVHRLSNDPDPVVEQNILAKAYNGVGECEKARGIIMNVIQSSPSYRDAYITLAAIEEREGNFEAAIQALYTAKSFSTYSGFIDKYISDLKKRSHFVMEAEKAQVKPFTPTHLIVFKSGKFIEGVLRGQTDDEINMYVQAGDTQFKVVVKKSDIERIIDHGAKGPGR